MQRLYCLLLCLCLPSVSSVVNQSSCLICVICVDPRPILFPPCPA